MPSPPGWRQGHSRRQAALCTEPGTGEPRLAVRGLAHLCMVLGVLAWDPGGAESLGSGEVGGGLGEGHSREQAAGQQEAWAGG